MGDLERDPLALTPDQMREMGHRMVDLLVDHLTDAEAPAIRRPAPGELERRLGGSPPDQGRAWDDVLDQLATDVLPYGSRLNHPGYFAYIPACSTFPGALGDLVTAALDVDASLWMSAAGHIALEQTVLGWFKDWIGYPPEAAGILVSGGSAANQTALACAREALLGPMTDRVSSTPPTSRTRPSRRPPGSWASGPTRCGSCRRTPATGCASTR